MYRTDSIKMAAGIMYIYRDINAYDGKLACGILGPRYYPAFKRHKWLFPYCFH